jgi:hypothetical protein
VNELTGGGATGAAGENQLVDPCYYAAFMCQNGTAVVTEFNCPALEGACALDPPARTAASEEGVGAPPAGSDSNATSAPATGTATASSSTEPETSEASISAADKTVFNGVLP